MQKYFGSLLVNGEDNDYFKTGGGKLWRSAGSFVINEETFQKALTCKNSNQTNVGENSPPRER